MARIFCTSGLVAAAALLASGCAGFSSREQADLTPASGLPRSAAGRSATLLSAFFGLDNTLPATANRICRGGAGLDGMPVIFSTEIDHATLQAGDFLVASRAGVQGRVHCVSFLPATDAGELRTVLLIGEFGNSPTDPPVRVEIRGHIHSIDGALDFQGASVGVTPLEQGPTLVMAERYDPDLRDQGLGMRRTRGSACPTAGIVQAVRVVWAGGVTLANGKEPGDAERSLYKVTVRDQRGAMRSVVPMALADLGDGDNNHLLCLDTADTPVSVAFPAGILTDPNKDLNPATAVDVTGKR